MIDQIPNSLQDGTQIISCTSRAEVDVEILKNTKYLEGDGVQFSCSLPKACWNHRQLAKSFVHQLTFYIVSNKNIQDLNFSSQISNYQKKRSVWQIGSVWH